MNFANTRQCERPTDVSRIRLRAFSINKGGLVAAFENFPKQSA